MAEREDKAALREFIESHVSSLIREAMEIEYEPSETRPTARFLAFGRHFRLEPEGESAWKLLSDGTDPQVLAQFDGEPEQFQRWLLLTIVDHTGGNGHKP